MNSVLGQRARLWKVVAAAVSAVVALGVWALSSPLGATPDEDFHLASTWCGLGEREDACAPGSKRTTREIPREVIYATCFAFHSEVSASCQASIEDPQKLRETKRGNFDGLYPPVFFAVTSAFVGPDAERSVLLMRLFNTLLYVGLVGAVALLSAPRMRRSVLVGAVVTAVPFGVFLIPSINPSSWALLSATTLLASVVGYLTTTGRRRWAFAGVSVVATVVGAGSRADAAVYAIIAIGVAGFLALPRDRTWWRAAILPTVLAAASAVSFLTSGQNNATEPLGDDPLTLQRVWDLVTAIPHLWVGAMGLWGLGWLDTDMPPMVWAVNWGVFFAVVFAALVHLPRRTGWSVAGMAALVVAIPVYVQYASGQPVGVTVQPRYILPLLIMLVTVATIRLEGRAFGLSRVQRWVVAGSLTLTNAVALHANLRRYVTGTDHPSLNLDSRIEWWWSGLPVTPLATWAIGVLAFGVLMVLVTRELQLDDDEWPDGEAPTTRAVETRPAAATDGDEPAEAAPATANGTHGTSGPSTTGPARLGTP